jgi:hypothetical protein
MAKEVKTMRPTEFVVVAELDGTTHTEKYEVYANSLYIRHLHAEGKIDTWAVMDALTGGSIAMYTDERIAIQFAEKLEREFGDLRWYFELDTDEGINHPITVYTRVIRQHTTYVRNIYDFADTADLAKLN